MVEMDPLTTEEQSVFDLEYTELVTAFTPYRQVQDIFMDRKDYVLNVCQMAKKQFTETFYGIDASGGFGFTMIRPEHVRRLTTDTGTTHTTWEVAVGTQGWANWIGSATTANKLKKEALIVILGLIDYVPSPKASAMIAKFANITFPVWYFEFAMRYQGAQGVHVWKLPKPKVIFPDKPIYIQVKYTATGLDELALLGITFAKADYLQTATPTVESP